MGNKIYGVSTPETASEMIPAIRTTANGFEYQDGDGNWNLIGGGDSLEVTFSQLSSLRSQKKLIPFQRYKITDYRTIYKMAKTTITMGREGDEHESELEPLIVLAIATDKLHYLAISELYQNDIIYYSIDNWGCEWSAYANGAKGVIYRRIDTLNNNDIPFDFRNIYFRRWKLNIASAQQFSASLLVDPVTSPEVGFKAFELLKIGMNYGITFTSSDTDYNDITTSGLYTAMPTTDLYISCDNDKFHTDAQMGKYGSHWGMSDGIPIDKNDYKDYRLFQLETNHVYRDTIIHSTGTSSSKVLPNIVFKQSSRRNNIMYAANVTICGNSYDNTVGRMNELTMFKDFSFNRIHASIANVIATGNFTNNHIDCNQMSACIFKDCIHNYIDGDIKYLYSGKVFSYNKISSIKFERNYCTEFAYNVVGSEEFSHNVICYFFRSNTISRYFYNNKFGETSATGIESCDLAYIANCTFIPMSFNRCENITDRDLSPYDNRINDSAGYLWHIRPTKNAEKVIAERINNDGTKDQIIMV